jgi:hypothetical protein
LVFEAGAHRRYLMGKKEKSRDIVFLMRISGCVLCTGIAVLRFEIA